MKEVVGYLLDRTTGAGVASKVVDFLLLDGTAVPATASTVYTPGGILGPGNITRGQKDTVTDANGRFSAWWELSPGPVNIEVAASGAPTPEEKARKWDEKAQLGYQWSSDISRIARGMSPGVVRGFLNHFDWDLSTPGGHTIRVKTGAAVFNGGIFSIENGPIDLAGTPNTNPALLSRWDLITLRQYNETATAQLAGKQTIVITEGVVTSVAPLTPTGSDFIDLPLWVVATAYNGTTKTPAPDGDRRVYTNPSATDQAPIVYRATSSAIWTLGTAYTDAPAAFTVAVTGLSPGVTYDGKVAFWGSLHYLNATGVTTAAIVSVDIPASVGYLGGPVTDVQLAKTQAAGGQTETIGFSYEWPIVGLTGVSTVTYRPRLKAPIAASHSIFFEGGTTIVTLTPRV